MGYPKGYPQCVRCRALGRYGVPTEVRFWKKVRKGPKTGCWQWMGAIVPGKRGGYGAFRAKGRVWKAHRYAWYLLRGKPPMIKDLDHRCRNRACVRPSHLEIVTRKENLRRGRVSRGA